MNRSVSKLAWGILFVFGLPACGGDEPTNPSDATAPAVTSDLTVESATTSAITLRWSAPGDDQTTGTATAYDLRYSVTPLTEGGWAAAMPTSSLPAPRIAGSPERFEVLDLDATTTYYFALRTADEVPSWSGISNVAVATTGEDAHGACCSVGGGCVVATEAGCNSAAGAYRGDGTNCDPDPCFLTDYCAIGDGMTAGFINGGLISGGQEASYPTLLARQAGFEIPNQPFVASPGIGFGAPSGLFQSALYVNALGIIATENVSNPLALLLNQDAPRPYENLGVPGSTTMDLLHSFSSETSHSGNNIFFDVVLRNGGLPPADRMTQVDAMNALNPRAVTLWTGTSDILGGALSGNPVVGGNITPVALWSQSFGDVVARIDAMNCSYVAIANVPNIVDIPYVTTVPPAFPFGQTPLPFNADEADVEYVLLPFGMLATTNPDTLTTFLQGFGTNSIPSQWTLTQREAQMIAETTTAYNDIIQAACAARGWAYVDISSELAVLPNNVFAPQFDVVNGLFPWFPLFSSGGVSFLRNELSAFGLDGVYPSEVGQALVANAFVRALNAAYSDLSIPDIPLTTVHNEVGFENAP